MAKLSISSKIYILMYPTFQPYSSVYVAHRKAFKGGGYLFRNMTGFADRKSKSSPTHPYFSHDTLNVEKFASTNFRENKISRGRPLHDRCLQILTNIFLSHGTDKFLMIIRKFDAFDFLPSPPFLFAYPSYCTMVSYKKACKHFTCYYVVTIKHTCNRTCAVIPYLRICVSGFL